MKKITVFCDSNAVNNKAYIRVIDHLAKVLVEQEISLVYGGEQFGLTGRLAESVLRQGGEVIGVIPEKLVSKALANRGISVLHIVKTIQEQHALIAELCDGYIAFTGSSGTGEEMIDKFTRAPAGYHYTTCGLLNMSGEHDNLPELMQAMNLACS